MIDWNEVADGDAWELFARDFLVELGFVIEVGPGRGPDGGLDLLISEQLRGRLQSRKFTWLVSCKHYAKEGKAVGLSHEENILERIKQHEANGFMGFYSTLPSSSLIIRLKKLKENHSIEAYTIFDHKVIEGNLSSVGMSCLAKNYIPGSIQYIRPIQKFLGHYESISCEHCGADVLARSVSGPTMANILYAYPNNNIEKFSDVYVVCKNCTTKFEQRLTQSGCFTMWKDLDDLFNPLEYLINVTAYMNMLHHGDEEITEKAHKKMIKIYNAAAQKVLRDVSKEEEAEFRDNRMWDGF